MSGFSLSQQYSIMLNGLNILMYANDENTQVF